MAEPNQSEPPAADNPQANNPEANNPRASGTILNCSAFRTEWHLPESLKLPKPFQDAYDQLYRSYETQKDPQTGQEARVVKSDYAIAAVDGVYVRFVDGLNSRDPVVIKSPEAEIAAKFIKANGEKNEVAPNTIFFLKLTGLGPKITGPRFLPLQSKPPEGALIIDLRA